MWCKPYITYVIFGRPQINCIKVVSRLNDDVFSIPIFEVAVEGAIE